MSFEVNKKIIALVDCNSFYCSCERLFRPDLKLKPVGVLSNNDGCFVSRTEELKQLGVQMGVPYFQVKKICDNNNVAVFSANFSLYTNISDRVMNTLFNFAPSLEIYSVDEAFLDLTGLDEKSIEEYCRNIKNTVERHTGIPVGIGIARTKVLAKIANRIAKKDKKTQGVFSLLSFNAQNISLANFPIEDVWGIGRQNSIKMKSLGIKNAIHLRDYKNDYQILKNFTKVGRMIQDELRGISCFPINEIAPQKKEIMCSRSFGNPIFEKYHLRESLASYASLACEKLRKQNSVCGEIEIFIMTNPHKDIPQYSKKKSFKLTASTSDTRKIIKQAWLLLDEIFQYGYEYKKAGIALKDIQDANEHQIALFGENDSLDDILIMKTMDQINLRDGQDSLKLMACGTKKEAWLMKQSMKSQRFVSGWSEIYKLKVHK